MCPDKLKCYLFRRVRRILIFIWVQCNVVHLVKKVLVAGLKWRRQIYYHHDIPSHLQPFCAPLLNHLVVGQHVQKRNIFPWSRRSVSQLSHFGSYDMVCFQGLWSRKGSFFDLIHEVFQLFLPHRVICITTAIHVCELVPRPREVLMGM